MKKLLLLFGLMSALVSFSQDKYSPDLKQGAKLNYVVFTDNQELPLMISVDSLASDFVKLGWNIEGLGNGGWIMKQKSLQSANRGWWSEPMAGTDQELADEQTVLLFSKASWDALQKDKKADYDMQSFAVSELKDDQQLKLNGKPVDVLLLQGENGSTRIWLLNNAAFPAILKIEGNTFGPDLELRSIE
jgi:hypothetical protein